MIKFILHGPSPRYEIQYKTWDAAVCGLYLLWDGENPWKWYIFDIQHEDSYFVNGIVYKRRYYGTSNEWYHRHMEDHREKIAKFNDRFDGHDWMKEGF